MTPHGGWMEQPQPQPAEPSDSAGVEYMAHIQRYGDTEFVAQPNECGTTGQSKRLEGFMVRLRPGSQDVGLRYKAHVQDEGDTGWCYLNQFIGTRGKSRRLEALWIEVTGEAADKYDIYYCAHLADTAWTPWMRNGEMCGTVGQSRRVEAIKLFLADK